MERFWIKVNKASDCWEWTGARLPAGYGVFWVNGKNEGAHRVSWQLHKGPIPDGLWVLHKCDNPRCVRPDHLFLGTPKDNTQDCQRKGRGGDSGIGDWVLQNVHLIPHGEEHSQAKLSAEAVSIIRAELRSGKSQRSLARHFKVNQSTVRDIAINKTWRHA